jgi:hypothetical protein
VYFAWDTSGLGWDQGVWYQTGNPVDNIVSLPDQQYRLLLKAVAAANSWDGTIPDAYRIWGILFAGTGYGILIIDNQDMSMDLGLYGHIPDVVTTALLEGGYLDLRPEGVRIAHYILPTGDGPLFGLDIENVAISGLDVGSWASIVDAS